MPNCNAGFRNIPQILETTTLLHELELADCAAARGVRYMSG